MCFFLSVHFLVLLSVRLLRGIVLFLRMFCTREDRRGKRGEEEEVEEQGSQVLEFTAGGTSGTV